MNLTARRGDAAIARTIARHGRRSAGIGATMEGLEGRRLMTTATYLSDLPMVSATNGLGPVELDTSSGGHTLTIGRKSYNKGLGVRATSVIVFNLDGLYNQFKSAVGVDREAGRNGSVYFRVFLDGKKAYDSGKRVGGQTAKTLALNVTGKKQLTLVVAAAGGNTDFDDADWANARLTSKRKLPPPTPAAPSGLLATATSNSQINVTWTDNAGNERSFTVERSTDGTHFDRAGAVNANVTEFQDTGLAAGTAYYYRVRATNAVGNSAYTSVATAATLPAPPTDSRPSASNTGPTNAAILKASGSIEVTQDGAVIQDLDVDGTITVSADNVTIRNFRVHSSDDYDISIGPNVENLVIEDGELTGSHVAAIYGPDFTARRLNIHDTGSDGIKPWSNVVIDSCYIHDLGMDPDAHADGIQESGGDDVTITNNNIDVPEHTVGSQTYLSNSTIFISSYFGPVTNVKIAGNWLNGGNYMVYSIDAGQGHGRPAGVQLSGNVFGPDYKYGLLDIEQP